MRTTASSLCPRGVDLGVDLLFRERWLQAGELTHCREKLIDLALLHGFAQQLRDGIGAQEPGVPSLLGKLIGPRFASELQRYPFPHSLGRVRKFDRQNGL